MDNLKWLDPFMRQEHMGIRELKPELKKASTEMGNNWGKKANSFWNIIIELCQTLRQHICKENQILYPMALRKITEDTEWDDMKIKCYKIGYC